MPDVSASVSSMNTSRCSPALVAASNSNSV